MEELVDKEKNIKEQKWFWMMDYCKDNNLPPAQKWAWDKAKEAYNILHDKEVKQ